jgi:type 1 glutamine amidotransferase
MPGMNPNRVHLITGGFPKGEMAGHDMDYARIRLLQLLSQHDSVHTTSANDFKDVELWLADCQFLITYVAGPFPDEDQNNFLQQWLENGGRWLALHGTSGGKAARLPDGKGRTMVKSDHHDTLGSFFLTHPPIRKIRIKVDNTPHPLIRNLPAEFEVEDELYLLEILDHNAKVLLTTELEQDPSPAGFGFAYASDTSIQTDGKSRVLGYVRDAGKGAVAYFALGHCHAPWCNVQPFVDESVSADGSTPLTFRGPWENQSFEQLLKNALDWGLNVSA